MKKLILVVALLASPVTHASSSDQRWCHLAGEAAQIINDGRNKGISFEQAAQINRSTSAGHRAATNISFVRTTYEVYSRNIYSSTLIGAEVEADCLANPEEYK